MWHLHISNNVKGADFLTDALNNQKCTFGSLERQMMARSADNRLSLAKYLVTTGCH